MAQHPLKPNVVVVKRVLRVESNGDLFLVGDNPDPLASEDSHNFGPSPNPWCGLSGSVNDGGPDGVRTRDRRIKSPSLYLTRLQARFRLLPRLFNA